MKRLRSTSRLLAVAIGILTMTSCSTDADDVYMDLRENFASFSVYEGVWTVDREIVDSARLDVTDHHLILLLPVDYLTRLCFPEDGEESQNNFSGYGNVTPHQELAHIAITGQGYTEKANYNVFSPEIRDFADKALFCQASFVVEKEGTELLVSLLSNEQGTAIYQTDYDQWTIGIPISCFLITNNETQEQIMRQLPAPVTIYFNTQRRID